VLSLAAGFWLSRRFRTRLLTGLICGLAAMAIFAVYIAVLAALTGDGDGDYPDWFYVAAIGAPVSLLLFIAGSVVGLIWLRPHHPD
jgi:hypothetical protein